jgi:hypothetical protein
MRHGQVGISGAPTGLDYFRFWDPRTALRLSWAIFDRSECELMDVAMRAGIDLPDDVAWVSVVRGVFFVVLTRICVLILYGWLVGRFLTETGFNFRFSM